jgi:hypothetical protein
VRRFLPPLLAFALALVLAACGTEGRAPQAGGGGGGDAQLWVTQNHGMEVVLDASVPSGISAIAALDRETDVKTRYGGRFIQSVNGIEGSLAHQRDWFYFLNGIEPDVGGAEVKLRPGDVVWWDYRAWGGEEERAVVVGAFPEPFLHGWGGKRRPAEVRAPAGLEAEAAALLETLGGPEGEGEPNVFAVEVVADTGATLTAERESANDAPVTFTLTGTLVAVQAALAALAEDPSVVRYRYDATFDGDGNVVE